VLFACDELAGFVARVRARAPGRALDARAALGAQRRLKQKSFASGVNREDVIEGAGSSASTSTTTSSS